MASAAPCLANTPFAEPDQSASAQTAWSAIRPMPCKDVPLERPDGMASALVSANPSRALALAATAREQARWSDDAARIAFWAEVHRLVSPVA